MLKGNAHSLASKFLCVPGGIPGPENLKIVSFYRLLSQSVNMFECQLHVRCYLCEQKAETDLHERLPYHNGCHEEVVQGAING